MDYNNETRCLLNLNRLVFDTIHFSRRGFKNDNDLNLQLEAHISQKSEQDIYRVSLILKGEKCDEYNFEIGLTGFFSFTSNEIDEEQKQTLISKNTLAILMPYLRSQVSLLTAQPETDCVVLPPLNINNIVDNSNSHKKTF